MCCRSCSGLSLREHRVVHVINQLQPYTSKRNRLLIGCSWQASRLVLNPGANKYTHPACSAKVCFIAATAAGDITTTVNRDRQAGPMSSTMTTTIT